MRIAQIAPVGSRVRRSGGESIQQLVGLLCDELVARGHDVTLFATGDSETTAELRYVFERGRDCEPDVWEWQFPEYMNVGNACTQADEFDVIHCHSYHCGVPFVPFVRTPNVHTPHIRMAPPVLDAYRRLPQVHLVVVSEYQARDYAGCASVDLIPHGIDTSAFPLGEGGPYLLFLGRLITEKGPGKAVQIARDLGMPLVIAGPAVRPGDQQTLERMEGVTYVGPVEPEERNRLLAGAGALLYPLLRPEPFGLVMLEAMACGTPVVATAIGAVPEVVEPGLTGYLGDSWEDLAGLVAAALELDRSAIRARAVERFDYTRMVDLHEQLYRRVITSR